MLWNTQEAPVVAVPMPTRDELAWAVWQRVGSPAVWVACAVLRCLGPLVFQHNRRFQKRRHPYFPFCNFWCEVDYRGACLLWKKSELLRHCSLSARVHIADCLREKVFFCQIWRPVCRMGCGGSAGGDLKCQRTCKTPPDTKPTCCHTQSILL